MNAEDLRKLKHELRTPVNHILGYSDLLLETADDCGDATAAGLARNVRASGQMLAKLLEKSLMSPTGEMDEAQMEALRESVRPTVRHILDTLTSHSPSLAAENSYSDDLDRIRRAANQLLALLGTDRIAAAK